MSLAWGKSECVRVVRVASWGSAVLVGIALWRALWVILVDGWRPAAWRGGGASPWRGPLCWLLASALTVVVLCGVGGIVEALRIWLAREDDGDDDDDAG